MENIFEFGFLMHTPWVDTKIKNRISLHNKESRVKRSKYLSHYVILIYSYQFANAIHFYFWKTWLKNIIVYERKSFRWKTWWLNVHFCEHISHRLNKGHNSYKFYFKTMFCDIKWKSFYSSVTLLIQGIVNFLEFLSYKRFININM